jgi:hypothetical protein
MRDQLQDLIAALLLVPSAENLDRPTIFHVKIGIGDTH